MEYQVKSASGIPPGNYLPEMKRCRIDLNYWFSSHLDSEIILRWVLLHNFTQIHKLVLNLTTHCFSTPGRNACYSIFFSTSGGCSQYIIFLFHKLRIFSESFLLMTMQNLFKDYIKTNILWPIVLEKFELWVALALGARYW